MTSAPKPTQLPLPCIDRIVSIEKGKRIQAKRFVNPDEEYFVDHFDGFPVLPGVLQLEGLVQASMWHVFAIENFTRSQIRLVECQSAKYSQLVRPGMDVIFDSELVATEDHLYSFKGKVSVEGRATASTQFKLRSNTLAEVSPIHAHLEQPLLVKSKSIFDLLTK